MTFVVVWFFQMQNSYYLLPKVCLFQLYGPKLKTSMKMWWKKSFFYSCPSSTQFPFPEVTTVTCFFYNLPCTFFEYTYIYILILNLEFHFMSFPLYILYTQFYIYIIFSFKTEKIYFLSLYCFLFQERKTHMLQATCTVSVPCLSFNSVSKRSVHIKWQLTPFSHCSSVLSMYVL